MATGKTATSKGTRFRWGKLAALLGLVALIGGCSQLKAGKAPPTPLPFNNALYTPVAVPEPSQFITLTDAQRAELADFVVRPDIAGLPVYKQAQRFLVTKLQDFGYEGKNLGASEALDSLGGNCMSLALVTLAVARELGVPAQFQLVHEAPVLLDMKDDLMVLSDHVRSLLYDAPMDTPFLSPYFGGYSIMVVDYFPSGNNLFGALLKQETFIAMFYRNLASDALIKGDLAAAYWLSREGLKWDSTYVPLINIAAIIHRRSDDDASAEALYRHALMLEPNNLNLLSNYRTLAIHKKDVVLEQSLVSRMEAIDEHNGYDFYLLGRDALVRGEYLAAERYLTKFLNSTPYFHPAWFDIARAQVALGKEDKAREALRQAMTLASQDEDLRKYQAKLAMIKTQAVRH
ncbi:tetratricopeptide repeat protein [Shewanella sedimentimangrovi]|uniref:Tetratricopeptide repeat protein n=1 Tax=Shewanella sedimentimangrovi TaxID=2814293 RepID=A0ABX7QY36_9GAMM|nr:hypothetical protein [Shewanella sedimentimangrovi]QSX35846.1 hypothetical protein JYB85_10750 [Shewanella sedimentimangrovi]